MMKMTLLFSKPMYVISWSLRHRSSWPLRCLLRIQVSGILYFWFLLQSRIMFMDDFYSLFTLFLLGPFFLCSSSNMEWAERFGGFLDLKNKKNKSKIDTMHISRIMFLSDPSSNYNHFFLLIFYLFIYTITPRIRTLDHLQQRFRRGLVEGS